MFAPASKTINLLVEPQSWLDSRTVLDPRVLTVWKKVKRRLRAAHISFEPIDGLALNLYQAGRPTFDVDVLVPRLKWQEAVTAVLPLTIGSERMGLPGEPEPGALLQSREGPFIEFFPSGVRAEDIARVRGRWRKHKAGSYALRLRTNSLIRLVNSKLASYLSATDRMKDLADVQELIKRQRLGREFAARLSPEVRSLFLRLQRGVSRPATRAASD
jgi:hypothetical protein